jgi:hypothetical protein
MITNETNKNLNLAKHPFGLGNGEYYSCPFRSGNCTVRLKVAKDMPIRVNTIFD